MSEPPAIGIVTRGDLIPPYHGAAVKIWKTAESLSHLARKVVLVTDDASAYVRIVAGKMTRIPYPAWVRWVPRARVVREALWDALGFPPAERRLFIPIVDPSFWVRAVWVVRTEKLDILQAEFPFHAFPALFARAFLGVRTSIVEHNVEHLRILEATGAGDRVGRRIRWLESLACRRVQDVIAVSELDRQRLVEMGVSLDRITVVPLGVDVRGFAASAVPREEMRARLGIAPGEVVLFFHGALHYAPNAEAVGIVGEEILPRLARRGVDVRAVIAGASPPLDRAGPGIVFTGAVEDLASHIHAADVAVVPLRRGGGIRMKILEYFAAGKPVISTVKGAEGLPVTDGMQILLARDDDWDGFADHVACLAASPAERERLGEEGRRFVQGYDWSEIARRTLEVYRRPRGPLEIARARYRAFVLPRLAEPRNRLEKGLARVHERRAARRLTRGYLSHIERPETSPPPEPKVLLLLVTRACNLHCRFCDLPERPDRMPIERMREILAAARRIGTQHAVFTGGEPFTHPEIFEAIAHAKRAGLGVNVTTNGSFIERDVDRIVASGLDSISISLDGLNGAHDDLRGVAGSLERTLRGIERIRAASPMKVDIYFVVTNRNVDQLRPVHAFARSIGAEFGFWPVNSCEALYVREPDRVREYQAALETMAREDPAIERRLDYFRRAIDYHGDGRLRVRCLGLVQQYGVDVEGNLLPCCLWGEKDLVVGNVFDDPLEELWLAPRTVEVRRAIFEKGCSGLCYNHSLHEFSETTGMPFLLAEEERASDGRG